MPETPSVNEGSFNCVARVATDPGGSAQDDNLVKFGTDRGLSHGTAEGAPRGSALHWPIALREQEGCSVKIKVGEEQAFPAIRLVGE